MTDRIARKIGVQTKHVAGHSFWGFEFVENTADVRWPFDSLTGRTVRFRDRVWGLIQTVHDVQG
jgi:hypothetical protein